MKSLTQDLVLKTKRLAHLSHGKYSDIRPRILIHINLAESLRYAYEMCSALYLDLEPIAEQLILDYCRELEIPTEYLQFSSGNHVIG